MTRRCARTRVAKYGGAASPQAEPRLQQQLILCDKYNR